MNFIISLLKFVGTIVIAYYLTVFTLGMIFFIAMQGP
jgi:hypothetical protein